MTDQSVISVMRHGPHGNPPWEENEKPASGQAACGPAGGTVNTTAFPDCPVNPATGAYYPNNTVPIDPNAQAIMAMIPDNPTAKTSMAISNSINVIPAS